VDGRIERGENMGKSYCNCTEKVGMGSMIRERGEGMVKIEYKN
jgi:hypothetical protein